MRCALWRLNSHIFYSCYVYSTSHLVLVYLRVAEIYTLFTDYTANDGVLMDNSGFIELLRDARILSRHDLTTHYANIIFREHAAKQDTPKRVNFAYFRVVLIPLLAAKKRMTVNDLLSRLCHFENKKVLEESVLAMQVDEAKVRHVSALCEAHPIGYSLLVTVLL